MAAPDQESIYQVALEATCELVGEASQTRVAIATGSPEEVTVVAASGDHAGDVVGVRIYLDEYPDAVRAGLLEVREPDGRLQPHAGKMFAIPGASLTARIRATRSR